MHLVKFSAMRTLLAALLVVVAVSQPWKHFQGSVNEAVRVCLPLIRLLTFATAPRLAQRQANRARQLVHCGTLYSCSLDAVVVQRLDNFNNLDSRTWQQRF